MSAKKQKLAKKPLPAPVSSSKKKVESSGISGIMGHPHFYTVLVALVILAVTVVRWRFIGMPLERDEGEYAYFGHLILNGVAPYIEAYNMKLPGMYYMYALIMGIFGETYKGIHIGFVLMNAGTMLLLFLSLKHFFSPVIGIITAGFYGLMGMSLHLLGFAAHATHFSVFYVSLALFLFARYEQKRTMLLALLTGAMFGMAFLMKQQALYFILFGGITFLVFELLEKPMNIFRTIKNVSVFSAGVFIPYILVLLIMLASGAFDRFWFWTIQYASKYVSGVPWEEGKKYLETTFTPIWNEHQWVWVLAMAGFAVLLFSKTTLKQKIFAIAFCVFAFLTTTPGFFFRQHYFVVLMPAGALMAAIALDFAGQMLVKFIRMPLTGVALPLIVFFVLFNSVTSNPQMVGYYKTENALGLCKAVYGTNPFVESVEIAKYIEQNSSDTDKVAVLGSEPQIPFYAHRRSATGHIYTYGLMEIHDYNLQMQEEMIAEIEKEKPKFLVFCNVPFSWLSKKDSPMKIFDWYGKYSQENYNVVGLVDIPDQGPSNIYWGADAQRNPQHKNCVWVFKRKDSMAQPALPVMPSDTTLKK